MARIPQPNFLRAWREYRGLTQARLAEAVGTTGAVISLLESGDRGLSDKWLLKLAPVLGTGPGHLLEVDPNDTSGEVLELFSQIPQDRRAQALAVLATFRETPTPAPGEDEASNVARIGGHRPRRRRSASDQTQQPKAGRDGKQP